MVYTGDMRVYFSGIGGVGIGPLALIAHEAGHEVTGSDRAESLMTQEVAARDIAYQLDQSGDYLRQTHKKAPIDWFVYTSALPADHPELVLARELGIKTAKRDELLAHIIAEKKLKLIAVAGTHGKTTTTGMLVWIFKQLGIPVSYSIGTTLSWGPSGHFDPASDYFVYECDEFDRNFLHFSPEQAIITSIEHDHIDTYPTEAEYFAAFDQFIAQANHSVLWQQDAPPHSREHGAHLIDKTDSTVQQQLARLPLAGQHNRENAYLVLANCLNNGLDEAAVTAALATFPGTNRRFEKLAEHLYSDYGHHPAEVQATLQMARELSSDVVLVYQPHQNIRQHEVKNAYTDELFADATEVFWLPTYLSREDPTLALLSPQELTAKLRDTACHFAEMNDELWQKIEAKRRAGALVLGMGAGSIDGWLRGQATK